MGILPSGNPFKGSSALPAPEAAEGWYQDPGNPSQLRYWSDGQWTELCRQSELPLVEDGEAAGVNAAERSDADALSQADALQEAEGQDLLAEEALTAGHVGGFHAGSRPAAKRRGNRAANFWLNMIIVSVVLEVVLVFSLMNAVSEDSDAADSSSQFKYALPEGLNAADSSPQTGDFVLLGLCVAVMLFIPFASIMWKIRSGYMKRQWDNLSESLDESI